MTAEMVRVCSLTEDFAVYPRHAVDSLHVNDLVHALEAGEELPVIVAEAVTLRIVDGIHRKRAWQKYAGDEAYVPVELRKYDSDALLFKDAVALNSRHGHRLTRADRSRSARMLEDFGIGLDEIALVLRTTAEQVEAVLARVVVVTNQEGKQERIPPKVYLKPTGTVHPEAASPPQGNTVATLVTQLIEEIRKGNLDLSMPGLKAQLRKLADTIDVFV